MGSAGDELERLMSENQEVFSEERRDCEETVVCRSGRDDGRSRYRRGVQGRLCAGGHHAASGRVHARLLPDPPRDAGAGSAADQHAGVF